MEKKQYNLVVEILSRLDKAGVLDKLVLVGSWCLLFYKEYFSKVKYISAIKTRDIDFLVPLPSRIGVKVNIVALLKDLGFIVGFYGDKGVMKLEHPELILEFLVPEKGKGSTSPYALPQLGINAQRLRFLSFLTYKKIQVSVEGIKITLPHPAVFSLHKLIISERRQDKEKAIRDKESAKRILKALIEKGESDTIKEVFGSVCVSWQKKILKNLDRVEDNEVISLLESKK
ncbi:MAG: GSU2403 family nucleotidyltransferase fold protein [bacterium]|nr:GSU2403 family nucleotidyltransferase fold protein [bacterium]